MDAAGIRAAVDVASTTLRAGATPRAAATSVAAATKVASHPPLYADAAAALELLGSRPIQPTGAVADALGAGRLLRTGTDEALDGLERMLRHGRIDSSERRLVGSGMNGDLYRVRVHDPDVPAAPPTWVVEKDAGAQAAQEEFGWRLARAMGIDHLVAAAIRREDGVARIVFRPGRGVTLTGVTDVPRLEQALAKSYLDDATLGLDATQAAQAARIDRHLLQVFDYLIANNDRSGSNALYDSLTRLFTFFDSGHAGRGELAVNGGTTLEPVLQLFQAGTGGGHVDIDPTVVDYLRRRLTPERINRLHEQVFAAPGIAGPKTRSIGERFIGHVSSDRYRAGIVARLEHLTTTGGYDHRPYVGDLAGELPPLVRDRPNARGVHNARTMFERF